MVPLAIPMGMGDYVDREQRIQGVVDLKSGVSPPESGVWQKKKEPRMSAALSNGVSLDDRAAAGDHAIQDHDYRDHEQEVNQSTGNVKRQESQRPEDDQDNRERDEHCSGTP